MKLSENELKSLKEEISTPYVIYDEEAIISNYKELQNALGKDKIILYSVKANPNPFILKVLDKCGLMFETASIGEIKLLLRNGINTSKIIYSGQAKLESQIEEAIFCGIKLYNLESVEEVKRLTYFADELKKDVKYMCRINPNMSVNNAVLKMGSTPSAFGISENEIETVINIDKKCKYSHFEGLFMYNGSQYYEAKDIVENCLYLQNLSKKIENKYKIQFSMIDYGGGFGVVENEHQHQLNLKELKKLVELKLIPQYVTSFFESGRYIVNSAGTLVTSVVDIKTSRGKKIVILDTGINHLGVRQYCYRLYDTFINCNYNDREECYQIFVGPTCTTIDNVHSEIKFRNLKIGDIIQIPYAGAYLLSYSPLFFCGRSIPKEVMIYKNGDMKINQICSDEIYT